MKHALILIAFMLTLSACDSTPNAHNPGFTAYATTMFLS